MTQNGHAFFRASEALQNDKEVVLAAVKNGAHATQNSSI